MAIRDAFLPEFDHEMGTTRKTLERVPETNTDWKPHDKSMIHGLLAGHLVELPTLVPPSPFSASRSTFRSDLPCAAATTHRHVHPPNSSSKIFDKNVAASRAAIAS